MSKQFTRIQIPELIQGSNEWHEARSQAIGASNMAILMTGQAFGKDVLDLYLEKTGIVPSTFDGNEHTERGTALEPEARALFEKMHDAPFPAEVWKIKEYPFMQASLDGRNAEKNALLEIKCPALKGHLAILKSGEIPIGYQWQMQKQLLVAGGDINYFMSYNPLATQIAIEIPLLPNREQQVKLFNASRKFWYAVKNRRPIVFSAAHGELKFVDEL